LSFNNVSTAMISTSSWSTYIACGHPGREDHVLSKFYLLELNRGAYNSCNILKQNWHYYGQSPLQRNLKNEWKSYWKGVKGCNYDKTKVSIKK
jgi:hypothetical protein